MNTQKLKNKPLSQQVGDLLKQQIISDVISAGDRLPAEMELAKKFGVSRTVIREALAILKNDGLIASQQGKGIIVLDMHERKAFRISDVFSKISRSEVNHFFEIRAILESEAAAFAASRGSDKELEEIVNSFEAMEKAFVRHEDGAEEHFAFNEAITKASHNPALSDLLSFLHAQLKSFAKKLRIITAQDACRTYTVRSEHRAMVEAIISRDPNKAREATNQHLRNAAKRAGLKIYEDNDK